MVGGVMPIELPTVHRTPDFDLTQIQTNVAEAFRALSKSVPFLDGALVGPVTLTTAPLAVAHRLGRVARGAIILRCAGPGVIGQMMTDGADALTITLRQSAGGSAAAFTLWVW